MQALNSNTVTGSLCREVDSLRARCASIIHSLIQCQNLSLKVRLQNELYSLENRRTELLKTAYLMLDKDFCDYLSIKLLIELCRRPISALN